DENDLLLAFGIWLDDSVTRKLEAFARRTNIVHIDTNYVEIANVKLTMAGMNRSLKENKKVTKIYFQVWRLELEVKTKKYSYTCKTLEMQFPKYAILVLDARNAIGLVLGKVYGVVRFGLPATMGGVVAQANAIVVDIDGHRSFLLNVQELAAIRVVNLPVEIMLLNNQHLRMVVEYED
ncbi:Agglutinin-like protein 1 precursor, partial [Ancistrocladus abbreviatus]